MQKMKLLRLPAVLISIAVIFGIVVITQGSKAQGLLKDLKKTQVAESRHVFDELAIHRGVRTSWEDYQEGLVNEFESAITYGEKRMVEFLEFRGFRI